MKVTQSCLTLFDPIDYTVQGILKARILEWIAIPFSRGPSQPRDLTQVSRIAGSFFTSWATRETHWRLKVVVMIIKGYCLLIKIHTQPHTHRVLKWVNYLILFLEFINLGIARLLWNIINLLTILPDARQRIKTLEASILIHRSLEFNHLCNIPTEDSYFFLFLLFPAKFSSAVEHFYGFCPRRFGYKLTAKCFLKISICPSENSS